MCLLKNTNTLFFFGPLNSPHPPTSPPTHTPPSPTNTVLQESYSEEDDIDDPLILAASCGDVVRVESLLNLGHPVDVQQTSYALTPLLVACQHGHTNCARALLDAGASFTPANTVGGPTNPLFFAVDSRRVTLVESLLQINGERKAEAKAKAKASKEKAKANASGGNGEEGEGEGEGEGGVLGGGEAGRDGWRCE